MAVTLDDNQRREYIPIVEKIKKQLTKIAIQLFRLLIVILFRYNISHAEFVEMARRYSGDISRIYFQK